MTPATPPAPPAAAAPDDGERLTRGRRYAVRGVMALASVLMVFAIFAVWANRQVLDAGNWADTSSQMLENPAIRTQVAANLVDQLYANVDVGAEVAGALPPRLKPLAAPAANGLQDLAQRVTEKLLQRPRIQQGWKTANQVTAQQFINIAEGNSAAITAQGNAVVLDLRVVLLNLVKRLGLPGKVSSQIPPSAGKIKIMSGNQVTTLQDGANALKGLSAVLPAIALALFAFAVFLARGRRRQTLFFVGLDMIAAGLLVLIARRVMGHEVVNSLVATEAGKPAGEAVWSIGTGMLRDVAQATVIMGIPVVVAAWLAGPRKAAVSLRRSMAPTLRDSPGIAYGVAGLVLALFIAWGPIHATRMLLPVLLMIALTVAGVAVLRRQTTEEFPDAEHGGAQAGLHRAVAAVKGDGSSSTTTGSKRFVRDGDKAASAQLDGLERLADLHDRGVLSDEEFASEKAILLARGQAGAPTT